VNGLRRVAGFLALLAFVRLLVLVGPLLAALAIVWPKEEDRRPVLVSFSLIVLVFYTLKRASSPRISSAPLSLTH
jgi:hypothetical protein